MYLRPVRIRTLMIATAIVASMLAVVPVVMNASMFNWLFLFCCTATLVLCSGASVALSWMFDVLLPPGPPSK